MSAAITKASLPSLSHTHTLSLSLLPFSLSPGCTITVDDDPPVWTDLDVGFELPENSVAGTAVTRTNSYVLLNDHDVDTLTYSLISADADAFNIATDGTLIVSHTGAEFDYESIPRYILSQTFT